MIDGYDIRKIQRKSMARRLGIVLQDPFLFSGTVRENIRYGRLEATDEEIEEAARTVGAHDFISACRRATTPTSTNAARTSPWASGSSSPSPAPSSPTHAS